MKKSFHKGLAMALSLILIMSVCLVGGTVIASETDGYTVTTTYGSASTDPIDTTNLLYGINPQENTAVDRWTNGENSCLPASMTKLSFGLELEATINKIKITSQNGYGSGATRLASYDIYIADSYSELYNEENKVATFSSDSTSTAYRTEIDTFEFSSDYAKTGKFIGFNVTKTDNQGNNKIYINEIEVFGIEVIPNYTVTTATGSINDTVDTQNLIYGKESLSFPGTHFAQLTNGNCKPISVGSASSAWPLKFSYQLDATYDISKVIVTSESGANRLAEYAIYVSDSKDNLFNAENQIALVSEGVFNSYSSTATTVDTIEFKADYDTRGSFFGIAFIDPTTATDLASAKIGEIEVLGTEYVVDWTVITSTGSTSDAINTNSLIYGIAPNEFPSVTELTNGVNSQRALSSVKKLTYDMGGLATVDGVRVISQNQTSVASSRLGAYEIYISNSLDNLYNAENKVAEINPEATTAGWRTYVDTFTFSEHYAKTGRYIGFNILARSVADANGYAYINEIEVTGTKKASVTATAGVGGTISPEGETVLNGTPVEYTFTPDDGYKVAEVIVNNVVVEDITDNKYTFAGTETGSNTIEVTFALIGDTNNDGYLDDGDLDVIKKHILGLEEADLGYADLDGDGDINLLDLVTAYEIQQGISPAVDSLEATLNLTHAEYTAAINRAAGFNSSATATDRLNAVFEKAESSQPITIAAIGGSITEGAGHNVMSGVSVSAADLGVTVNGSTYENSKYVDRVANWFGNNFKNATVNKVNAGFSGTPSFFGTFRLEHDVLSKNPDLVIVEFSVNDLGNYQLEEGYMLDAYESVIRKSLESGAAVVAVFTVNNLTYQTTNIGNSWQNYHKLIAEHYNIPTVSYHNAIYPNGEWITEWTKLSGDNVHPNVAGHALLANCITSYFEDVYAMNNHTATNIPTEWYHNDTFAQTDIIYMGDVEFNGMSKVASNKYGYIARNATGTGNESFTAKIPAGATEVYVFYNTISNAGSIHAKLGDNAESEAFSTNVSSISYSHGEWTRIYNGVALSEDTTLTIRSANDGKALEILSILVIK